MLQIANKMAYLMQIFAKNTVQCSHYSLTLQSCLKMAMLICMTVRVWHCISHVNFDDSRTFCSILGAAVQLRARLFHGNLMVGLRHSLAKYVSANTMLVLQQPCSSLVSS